MSKPVKKKYYSLRSYGSYIGNHKPRFGVVIAVFVISNISLALIPVFIGKLVGDLSANPMRGHQAVVDVWVLIGLSSGHNLTWRFGELLFMKLLTPLCYLYENILFRQVIQKPYPYFIDKFTGKISSYIGTISQELRELITQVAYNYTSQVVGVVAMGIILTSINWQTGALFAAGIICMMLVGRHTIGNSARYEKLWADTQSTKNAKIIDTVANFVNVKSFQKEQIETKAIETEQDKTIAAAKRSFKWAIIFWASMSFFVRDVIWPATIGLNVYLFFHHEISIGQLTTLLSTILVFTSTIWDFIWFASQFNLQLARAEEAHQYLFGGVNIFREYQREQEHAIQSRPLKRALELHNLSFAYPDREHTTVLHSINLTLQKGEKVGIVGKSGSGKTTLTKLMLGYYPAKPGEVLLDGQNIDTRDLAAIISYVPQDTSLFHRTIADNIAYAADKEVTRQDVIRAAKQAHADEFIAQISDGYEAMVGERGVKLSAGQRQRIAIARAFLDDKPVLILDEATSALDSESEILVQEALENLWKHKTVIAIAHRLSTLRHMDKIIVIDEGKIIEQGTHQELLKANKTYAKLWAHQSGGFIED